MYKNCNSLFKFKKIKNSNLYKITNKIKNNVGSFVKNYSCIINEKDLKTFLNQRVYH